MKLKFRMLVYLSTIFFMLGGCTLTPLEKALKQSGSNRTELQKVLDHFSKKEDSLKFQAVKFLIENMPGHYTLVGKSLDNYYNSIDSIFRHYSFYYRYYYKTIPLRKPEIASKLKRIDDLSSISSDFLIPYIEDIFKQKEKTPWLQDMSFKDFCEYVLPYRIGNEPVQLYDTFFQNNDHKINDSILHFYDNLKYNTSAAMFYMINTHESYKNADPLVSIFYDGELLNHSLLCFESNFLTWYKCKFHRIPVAFDFIPYYANRNNGHSWLCAIDNKFHHHTFSDYHPIQAGRIYRYTFSRHSIPEPHNNEYVPSLFRNPFQVNVTSYYLPVSNISICISQDISKYNKYAYLSIFNSKKWEPIAFSEIKNNNAFFTEMGRGIVYLPIIYHKKNPIPANFPFILQTDGSVKILIPDTTQLQNLTITRKYPTSSHLVSSDLNLIGGRIEASNDKNFNEFDTLATIESLSYLSYIEISIKSHKAYRYWRLNIPDDKIVYISHIEWLNQENIIQGKTINGIKTIDASSTSSENLLNYSGIKDWVGIDCGIPLFITKIRYILRNDANNIFKNNVYELFYFSLKGWISLGQKTAESNNLTYNNIPHNALLWLRNINEGKEERIFTIINNGQIKFW